MHLQPNTLLQARYRVVRLLAQGGMGAVYEATDERLGSTVALKQTLVADPQLRAAFEREARLLAGTHHPALPVVSDHFAEGSDQFLVMQFIPGDDLGAMLQGRGRPFPLSEVLGWADRLLDALDYLHSRRPPIVHRDIKPQNLKLTARGEIVLLDFGLAKGEPGGGTAASAPSIFGYTPQYAPLEQIQGSGTAPHSDLYSVGATLYELLVGAPPPDALTRAAAAVSGRPDPLRPAHELNPGLPPALSTLLLEAMALDPARRPASAAALRAALGDLARGAYQPTSATISNGPPSSAGRPTILAPAGGSAGMETINIGAPTALGSAVPPRVAGRPAVKHWAARFKLIELILAGVLAGLLVLAFLIYFAPLAAPTTVDLPPLPEIEMVEEAPGGDAGTSRAEPLPFNGVARVDGWEVRLIESVRGDEAWGLLRQANGNNQPPPADMEYVLLRIDARSTAGESQDAFDRGRLHLVGSRGVAHRGFAAVPPEPILGEDRDVAAGGGTDGWSAFLVGADEPDLLLMVGDYVIEAPRYIALSPGAALSPPRGLESAAPAELGADPREPAGVTDVVAAGAWEARLIEMYRGEEAYRRLIEANPFNDPPPEGEEYLLALVELRRLDSLDEPVLAFSGFFSGGSGAESISVTRGVTPEPELHEALFPGGRTRGWVSTTVRAGDPDARLILFVSTASGSGEERATRYFAP